MSQRPAIKKFAILAAGVSLACGFLHALPYLGMPASRDSLLAAARGIAAGRQLAGYGTAGANDLVAGALWKIGGPSLLCWGQWLEVLLGWSLAALMTMGVIWAVTRLLNDRKVREIIIGSTVALVLATGLPGIWEGIFNRSERLSELRLSAPVELVQKVASMDKERLFASPSTLPFLLIFTPAAAGGIPPGEAAALIANPPKWREALRQAKWQAVLLTGALSEYRPLLDHLLQSPDWRLDAITNQGYLFLRGAGLPAKSIDPETFHQSSNLTTAIYLAQIAERYDAIRRTNEARACMEKALELAPKNAVVLSHAASFAVSHKRWQDAMAFSSRALREDPNFPHAKIVMALALLETGEPSRAQKLVDEVLLQAPDDLYTLFLSARISRALHDYGREVAALEKLAAISRQAGLPVLNYEIFLGQAYARLGQGKEALKNYRAVLASGQISPEGADEIRDAIHTIEEKTRTER